MCNLFAWLLSVLCSVPPVSRLCHSACPRFRWQAFLSFYSPAKHSLSESCLLIASISGLHG